MKKFLIILLLYLSVTVSHAEIWTPIGEVQWTEGALTGSRFFWGGYERNLNQTWSTIIEKSDSRPGVFRMQPYANDVLRSVTSSVLKSEDVYVYLHVDDLERVYLDYYIRPAYISGNENIRHYFHVWQKCPEDRFYGYRYYGKILGDTIIFPIGAFFMDDITDGSSQTTLSSSVSSSRFEHKIVFPNGIREHIPEAWVKIGRGHWEDPFWLENGEPRTENIDIERSIQHPNIYRAKIFDEEYVNIFIESPSKVYISPYHHKYYEGGELSSITIFHSCDANGSGGAKNNDNNYGTLSNGKVTIPGNYFGATYESRGYSLRCSSSRKCEIVFPEGYPILSDNGVFMGIIGFNDNITSKSISLLNEDTKDEFTSFVNELQMGNATLLYYAIDQAIGSMKSQTFPENLSNAILVTFTDGLDQGSLGMKPEYRTSKGYADYLSNLITGTNIQGHPLEAYAIGLKSEDVYDDELFMYNLQAIASKDSREDHISSVSNIAELQQKLTELVENLNKQTTQKRVTIKVPMMSHGDKYRFTLDYSYDSALNSNCWFEGVFNIDNMSLENVIYNGFTSTSGTVLNAKHEGIKLIFELNDCRNKNGYLLEVEKNGIDQWQYISSRGIWNHNVENAKADDVDIQNIKSSVAIMFALDCSTSLGDLFPLVKSTANSFIDRLVVGDVGAGIEDLIIHSNPSSIDINDPEVEIYNLQGIRVSNPGSGIYICRKGNEVKKIVVR